MNPREGYRPPSPKHAVLIGLFVAALSAGALPASSQTRAPQLSMPDTLLIDAGREHPLPVAIKPGAALPGNAMVLISGLPSSSVLSAGRLFDSGVWALRPADLNGLTIQTTSTAGGEAKLALSLVTLDGKALARRSATLSILPPTTAAAARMKPERTLTATAVPAARPAPAEAGEDSRMLVAAGNLNLSAGKMAVARRFFRRAAERGWAPGALALAQTYDPNELSRLILLRKVEPDAEMARVWYEKARQMGAAEAEAKLRRLPARAR